MKNIPYLLVCISLIALAVYERLAFGVAGVIETFLAVFACITFPIIVGNMRRDYILNSRNRG